MKNKIHLPIGNPCNFHFFFIFFCNKKWICYFQIPIWKTNFFHFFSFFGGYQKMFRKHTFFRFPYWKLKKKTPKKLFFSIKKLKLKLKKTYMFQDSLLETEVKKLPKNFFCQPKNVKYFVFFKEIFCF